MGDRADFVAPLPISVMSYRLPSQQSDADKQLLLQYDQLYRESAAYFQYGWTAGSMPIPFGKREIVYMMQNPRADSVYGRAPLEVLNNVILNLVYGADFNLDFYLNNNMPDGAIQLAGADADQIKQFRENLESKFIF